MAWSTSPDGGYFSGTGFVWPDETHIVTAYHVVANALTDQIEVHFKMCGEIVYKAQIEKIHKKADLALLSIERKVQKAIPLTIADIQKPLKGEQLVVIGAPLDIPSLISREIQSQKLAPEKLDQILNPGLFKEIQKLGYPDINITIQALEHGLLPGDSGAPLFNNKGQVAAIGDGGYHSGAASINWAIPVKYLNELKNSKEKPKDEKITSEKIKSLFWCGFDKDTGEKEITGLKEKGNFNETTIHIYIRSLKKVILTVEGNYVTIKGTDIHDRPVEIKITIDLFAEQYVQSLKDQIEQLKDRIIDKEEIIADKEDIIELLNTRESKEIQELRNRLSEKEAELQRMKDQVEQILNTYSNRDITKEADLYKQAWELFIRGDIDGALTILDEAKLKEKEIRLKEEEIILGVY